MCSSARSRRCASARPAGPCSTTTAPTSTCKAAGRIPPTSGCEIDANSARKDRGVELLAPQPHPVPCVEFEGANDSPGASMNNPNQQKPNQQQQNNPRPGEQQGGGGQ